MRARGQRIRLRGLLPLLVVVALYRVNWLCSNAYQAITAADLKLILRPQELKYLQLFVATGI
jgi:hypothetical protein